MFIVHRDILQKHGHNTLQLAAILLLKLTLAFIPVIPSSYNYYKFITIMNLLFGVSSASYFWRLYEGH